MAEGPKPAKWKKYLKLEEYGLVEQEDLEAEIHRFSSGDREGFARAIVADLQREVGLGHRNLYVVKLVPLGLPGQLPNYRIRSAAELPKLLNFVDRAATADYKEIWYCRTRLDPHIFSVAGRMLLVPHSGSAGQVVEQVWRCSPRQIEEFGPSFAYPYVRAVRSEWGRRFRVEQVHLPPGGDITEQAAVEQFWYTVQEIEQRRERLDAFCDYLSSFGFASYSLEYKLVGTRLSVIDWDTPNDLRVVHTEEGESP